MIVLNLLLTVFVLMGVLGGFLYLYGIIVGALSGLAFFAGRRVDKGRRARRAFAGVTPRDDLHPDADAKRDAYADADA